ncbi:hypothetical protein K449DRAFT_396316 [Hypoxylon sp. EC38]|nr:hypothetical protein K449DRAFT_396316 [Hypoxylon sp. EC38]
MASSSGHSVTIDRAQFETILRRVNVEYTTSSQTLEPLVCIPRAEYAGLVECQRQHEILKHNLMVSGMDAASLATLCEEEIAPEAQARGSLNKKSPPDLITFTPVRDTYQITPQRIETVRGAKLNQTPFTPYPLPRPVNHDVGKLPMGTGVSDHSGSGLKPSPLDKGTRPAEPIPTLADAQEFEVHGGDGEKLKYHLKGQRSLLLVNVPHGVTHWDITSVVRGGRLVDVYVREANRTAIVSFLTEENAKAFFEHAQNNNIVINNEEIHVRWANRQYVLTANVARKAAIGATRNLVIRNYDVGLTGDMIRADLEHIHGLVIIKIDFIGRDCYIKTSSIHHSLYAKSCMRSRLKYKLSEIEWGVDECDQPIEAVQETPVKKIREQTKQPVPLTPIRMKKTLSKSQNRFRVLDDDSDM